MGFRFSFLTVCLFVATLSSIQVKASESFFHIQTDKPKYQLGETLWYRIHSPPDFKAPRSTNLKLTLFDSKNTEVYSETLKPTLTTKIYSGKFFLNPEWGGGQHRLELIQQGKTLHRLPLNFHLLKTPKLDIEVTLLEPVYYPGDIVTALLKARDLEGNLLTQSRVEYLASFSGENIREKSIETDLKGMSFIKFKIPESTIDNGKLAVAVISKKQREAVSIEIPISASVADLSFHPEGGNLIPNFSQRLAIYARNLNNAPAQSAGRIIDDRGETITSFTTDHRGLTTVEFTPDEKSSYFGVIDLPKDVKSNFEVPFHKKRPYSLKIIPSKYKITAFVFVGSKSSTGNAEIILTQNSNIIAKTTRNLKQGDNRIEFNRPKLEGMGEIMLKQNKKIHARSLVEFYGKAPVRVQLKPLDKGPLLPGTQAKFQVLTTRRGMPVPSKISLSIFQGNEASSPDLVDRLAFANAHPEWKSFYERNGSHQMDLAARLAFHDIAIPDGGLEPKQLLTANTFVAQKFVTIPYRFPPTKKYSVAKRPSKKTSVVDRSIDNLLRRALYTKLWLPSTEEIRFELATPKEKIVKSQKLNRVSKKPPQKSRVSSSKIDTRSTLYWNDLLETNHRGVATIKISTNDLMGDLNWEAQGFSSDGSPIARREELKISPTFRSKFYKPKHFKVGDVFELWVEVNTETLSKKPLYLTVETGKQLKPLLRTKVKLDPKKDSRFQKFKFEVIEKTPLSHFRTMIKQGNYREVRKHPYKVNAQTYTQHKTIVGRNQASIDFKAQVPKDVIPGTLKVYAHVTPGHSLNEFSFESFQNQFQPPYGCFEQFTSINIVNLMLLDNLRRAKFPIQNLQTAKKYLMEGFKKFDRYYDVKTGAYKMFDNREPSIRPTLVAVRHLALYDRLFEGLGKSKLERALSWLKKKQKSIGNLEKLYLSRSLQDTGRIWLSAKDFMNYKTWDYYQLALVADCMTNWPEGIDKKDIDPEKWDKKVNGHLERLLSLINKGDIGLNRSSGIFGEYGNQSRISITALTTTALIQAGRIQEANSLTDKLIQDWRRSWATNTRSLVMRAFAKAPPAPSLRGKNFFVKFNPSLGRVQQKKVPMGFRERLSFEKLHSAQAGDSVELNLAVEGKERFNYRMGMSYDIPEHALPKNKNPKFKLSHYLPKVLTREVPSELKVTIRQRKETSSSQILLRIGLPAGLEPVQEGMEKLLQNNKNLLYWERAPEYLDLYFSNEQLIRDTYVIPIVPHLSGNFSGLHSLINPYYSSGESCVADPLHVTVVDPHESKVTPAGVIIEEKIRGTQKKK